MQQTHVLVGQQTAAPAAGRPASRSALRRFSRVGQFASDGVLLWFAFYLAYVARYTFEIGGAVPFYSWTPFSTYHKRALIFVGLGLLVLTLRGIYRLPRSVGLLDEAVTVIGGVTTAISGVVLVAYLSRFTPSRLLFIYVWAAAIVLLVLKRMIVRMGKRWCWHRDIAVDRVLVVGAGDPGRRVMQALMSSPNHGYRVVGYVDDDSEADSLAVATETRVVLAERLGATTDLASVIASYQVAEVIIALPGHDHARSLELMTACRDQGIIFKVVPDLFQLSLDRAELGEVAGVPLIGINDASLSGMAYLTKRVLDILTSIVLLLGMAIPMVIIAVLIKLDSRGPFFFRQQRIGRNGQPFEMTKFRCMVDGADELRADLIAAQGGGQDPRLFKMRNDPRLTPIGRFLRRFSLDELPQFVHILRGEMSLVGPRPQLLEEVEGYDDWHRQRLLVTPGLTGLWQVNGRSNLTFDEMVRLDLYYAEHWSLWLDVKIILRSIPAVFTGRGAY